MLYLRILDQIEGKEDMTAYIQYEWQYEDFYRDIEDQKMVNFRYGDHRDRVPGNDHKSLHHLRYEADKANQGWKWFRYGNDGFFDWFFKFVKF